MGGMKRMRRMERFRKIGKQIIGKFREFLNKIDSVVALLQNMGWNGGKGERRW